MAPRARAYHVVLGRLLLAMGAGAGVSTCGENEDTRCTGDHPPVTYCLDAGEMRNMARHGTGQVPLDPPPTEAEIDAMFLSNGCLHHDWVASSCCNPALGPGDREGEECCYQICDSSVCCGRALVLGARTLVAPLEQRADWLATGASVAEPSSGELSAAERTRLAELWQADALMEHASIASFARFSLQLLALGAPARLVRDAQAAALDEVRHAEHAFSIASRLAGRAIGPGGLPELESPLDTDLLSVARSTLVEGCIGETLAAMVAREQASEASDPHIRGALLAVAEDETRHAELAFRFVAWALVRGGAQLRSALRDEAARRLAHVPEPCATAGVSTAALHRHGRLTAKEQRAVHLRVRDELLRPALAALFSSPPERTSLAAQHA